MTLRKSPWQLFWIRDVSRSGSGKSDQKTNFKKMVLVQVATCYLLLYFLFLLGPWLRLLVKKSWNCQTCSFFFWSIGSELLEYWISKSDVEFVCFILSPSNITWTHLRSRSFVQKPYRTTAGFSGCLVTMASDTAGSFEVEAPVAAPRRTRKCLGPSLKLMKKENMVISWLGITYLAWVKYTVS